MATTRWLALAALIVACSEQITSGEIIEKAHREAWSQLIFLPLTTCSGSKVTTCNTMLVPMFFFHPESWRLKLKDYSRNIVGFVYVSEEAYEQAQVGGWFQSEVVSTDEPVYKRRSKGDELVDASPKEWEVASDNNN